MFHGSLVSVSFNASLRLHTRPINVVVFNVPSGDLEVSGELIWGKFLCLDASALISSAFSYGQCHWHDNPNTSDASTPVLSY